MQNAPLDLSRIQPGFSSPVFASQTVFRHCLSALSRPGLIVDVAHDAVVPPPLMHAAGAVALTLLDHDTTVWLSASLRDVDVEAFLRFHTGCRLTHEPGAASFAFAASFEELPPLDAFALGNDEHPENSVTLILQSPLLSANIGWTLSGPGIHRSTQMRAAGYGADFAAAWRVNQSLFPCGADAIFVSNNRLCGLPRTTLIGL